MFIVSKLFWLLAVPGNCFVLLLVLAALLLLTRWRRLGMRLVGLLAVLAVAIMMLPLGAWLVIPLEDRFPVPSPMPAHVDGVIGLAHAALGRHLPSSGLECDPLSRRLPHRRPEGGDQGSRLRRRARPVESGPA